MFTQEDIKHLQEELENSMAGMMGITLCPTDDNTVRATMPVDRNTSRPPGILNGGASLALAETLAGYGSYGILGTHTAAFGIQVSANHIAVARMGERVVGVATPLHIGRSTHIWDVAITSETTGKVVSSIRVVNFIANVRV
ncbi:MULTISPECIES: PaaI family thioesterase [Mediterranea]|uniref:PaaI family thioesterase n=1 Tax=Mediterranea TaxID=1926659 RepID=UPI002012EB5D|nr:MULTISPECIES: PaaI family thioesterase [Mediterranea]MCL1607183.1 PaaI family thioesterase [Mediterranea sp. ET5]MDM8121679.1 PaaI family thioesterase [Mediterranea massiliensis]MDM8198590.1 PaaI family thioesterase [Mediterranea massiliensis]